MVERQSRMPSSVCSTLFAVIINNDHQIYLFYFFSYSTAAFSPLKNRLMSGVVACPSNLQREDLDALWAMITYHGGHFQINLDKMCTHLISGKAEGVKYEKALTMSDKIKIVTPDWVIDSIKGKALCDEELYHPKLLILPGDKVETKNETSITPVSIHDTMNMITSTISEQQSNTVTSAPSTQVTLRTVSLPPPTMVASVNAPGLGQQARPLRVLVPSQNQELNPVVPQQSGQPRQVYLALQQPQIRQQQVNLAQVRQHAPRGPVTEGVQPVKPIILQQRIQPPGNLDFSAIKTQTVTHSMLIFTILILFDRGRMV